MNLRTCAAGVLVLTAAIPGVSFSQPAVDTAWTAVQSLPAGAAVAIDVYGGSATRGQVVHVTADAIDVRTRSEDRAIARSDIRRLRVPAKDRRLLYGIIGAAAGGVGGYFVCPYCANEGHAGKGWRNVALLAAAGSLLALVPSLHTIYEGARQDSLP